MNLKTTQLDFDSFIGKNPIFLGGNGCVLWFFGKGRERGVS